MPFRTFGSRTHFSNTLKMLRQFELWILQPVCKLHPTKPWNMSKCKLFSSLGIARLGLPTFCNFWAWSRYIYIVWKLHKLSGFQFLREIKVGGSRVSKSVISTHLEAFSFDFHELLHSTKWVSRKIFIVGNTETCPLF